MKTGFLYIIFIFWAVGISAAQDIQPQQDVIPVKTRYGFAINRLPVVNFNIYADFDPIKWYPRLYLAVAIQNDVLQFKKDEKGFTARYQISIAVRGEKGVVFKSTWKHSTSVKTFELTNSRSRFQYSAFPIKQIYPYDDVKIEPGRYNCLLEVRDLNAKTSYRSTREFNVPAADSLSKENPAASEITFIISPPRDSLMKLYPTGRVLRFNQQVYSFFRLKTGKPQDKPLDFNVRIFLKEKNQDILYYNTPLRIQPDSLSAAVLFKMPMDSLPEGDYLLRFETELNNHIFSHERDFSVIWFEKPVYLYRADLAIRPMRYVLSADEFERVKSLSYDELTKWMDQYWRKRDPTPHTIYNELLAVFYERVQQANKKYSTRFQEGWETDRGRILILYGEPDEVINNRYAATSTPYIVWVYKKENQEFIFIDKNGTGEFTLLKKEDEEN